MAAVLCRFKNKGLEFKIRMDWTAGEEMAFSLSSIHSSILFTILLLALNTRGRCHNTRNLSTQQNAASKRRPIFRKWSNSL